MNKFAYALLFISIPLIAIYILMPSKVYHEPGILVDSRPKQVKIINGKSWVYENYDFRPLAEINLDARVLSKKYYTSDRESDISPLDLALGWGKMSDSAILDKIDISQRLRWYFWKTPKFPIPRKEIELSSANMHMIPSNESIENTLDAVLEGNVIRLEGILVEITADDGYRWRSSLNRSDNGNGACEIVWVTKLNILR